jgi:hypothetical protein
MTTEIVHVHGLRLRMTLNTWCFVNVHEYINLAVVYL